MSGRALRKLREERERAEQKKAAAAAAANNNGSIDEEESDSDDDGDGANGGAGGRGGSGFAAMAMMDSDSDSDSDSESDESESENDNGGEDKPDGHLVEGASEPELVTEDARDAKQQAEGEEEEEEEEDIDAILSEFQSTSVSATDARHSGGTSSQPRANRWIGSPPLRFGRSRSRSRTFHGCPPGRRRRRNGKSRRPKRSGCSCRCGSRAEEQDASRHEGTECTGDAQHGGGTGSHAGAEVCLWAAGRVVGQTSQLCRWWFGHGD